MSKNQRFILSNLLSIILTTIILVSCNGPTQTAQGNGSETVALVRGHIVTPEGLSASGALVRLIPKDFNPIVQGDVSTENQAIVDISGAFVFSPKIQKDAHYNLEIHYVKTSMSLMHANIVFNNGQAIFSKDTVRMPGAVVLRIPAETGEGYVFMRGTTRTVLIDSEAKKRGTVLLDSIPAGSIAAIEYSPLSTPANTTTLSDTLTVISKNLNVRGNLMIYKDDQSLVTGTWFNPSLGSLIQDSVTPAYEGLKSYRFDYILDTTYGYAGVGLNLDNWWKGATYDFSHCNKIIAAYKGLATSHGLYIQLRDNNAVSNNVFIGNTSNSFVQSEALISAFKGVNLTQIREIIFGVSDSTNKVGNGTVWIDNVEVEY